MSAFRDSTVVMIDTSRTSIRAGHGLHDLLKTPSVEIPARVGLRRAVLEAASELTNGSNENGESTQPKASSSKTPSINAKVTDYLVGSQLDEALASGQDIVVFWPFAEGDISDWTQAEALWKHVLFSQLQLRRVLMESPVLFSIQAGLSRDAHERLCQIFFERFNVAGFAILERPMAQFYAAIAGNDLSGVVVDIGQDYTDITPILDGFIVQRARESLPYGISHCERYLAYLLRSSPGVMNALFPPSGEPITPEAQESTLVELAHHIWQEGLVKVLAEGEAADIEEEGITDIAAVLVAGKEKAVIESGMKKRQNAKATAAEQARAREIEAMDLVTVEFRGLSLTLGKERHRFCEPLFDPTLLTNIPGAYKDTMMPLASAVGHAVSKVEVDNRQYVWQGLLVTGDITNKIKGLGTALQARLQPFILSAADQANDVQPRSIRVIKVPDYFAEYRDKGDGLASFLGLSIVAKLVFTDSSGKNFVSKADYVESGPKVILDMSPALL